MCLVFQIKDIIASIILDGGKNEPNVDLGMYVFQHKTVRWLTLQPFFVGDFHSVVLQRVVLGKLSKGFMHLHECTS